MSTQTEKKTGLAPLRVLLFEEGDRWVAQCVDFDICTSADSFDDVHVNFARQLLIELAECQRFGKTLADLPKAPTGFVESWEQTDPKTAALAPITIQSLIEKIRKKSELAATACDIVDDEEEEVVGSSEEIPSFVPHASVIATLGLDGLDRRIRG